MRVLLSLAAAIRLQRAAGRAGTRVGERIVDRTCDRTCDRTSGDQIERLTASVPHAGRACMREPSEHRAAGHRGSTLQAAEALLLTVMSGRPSGVHVGSQRSEELTRPRAERRAHRTCARALDCCLAAAEPAGERSAPVDKEAAPMGFSSKFSCTGRVEGLPTAVPALETVANQVSAVLAAALPSEHHRLASGHADTHCTAVELTRVKILKIRLGGSLRTRLEANFAQSSDVSRRTQRRGAPLLAAPCQNPTWFAALKAR